VIEQNKIPALKDNRWVNHSTVCPRYLYLISLFYGRGTRGWGKLSNQDIYFKCIRNYLK